MAFVNPPSKALKHYDVPQDEKKEQKVYLKK